MKKTIYLLLLLFSSLAIRGQGNYWTQDSTISFRIPKNSFRAKAEVISFNILLNRYNWWIKGKDWADINPGTWHDNLKIGFQTDGDTFKTNLFGHPYHGSMFHNSARLSGYSYWGSIPHTIMGSLVWEYFGENHTPSEIDFNSTTLGGMYLGEITFRLASKILENDKTRGYWFYRNSLAFLLNPMMQINSLMFSETSHAIRKSNSPNLPIISQLSFGINVPFGSEDKYNIGTRAHFKYTLLFGDLFDDSKSYKPFDFFILNTWLDVHVSDPKGSNYFNISTHAPIFRKLISDKSTLTVSQHYDYLQNEVFKIGAMSLTGDYSFRNLSSTWTFIGSGKAGVIIFGTSNSEVVDYIYNGDEKFVRDYVYGNGITFELEFLLKLSNYGHIISSYNNWIIYPHRDAKGTERTSILQIDYYYPVFKNTSLGIELYFYERDAHYDDYPQFQNITGNYFELKALASITF